jgi:putative protease
MNQIELLAPAGDLDKLKFAIAYGADAVYIGGEIFGLRASAKNFSFEDMKTGVNYAHDRGKKVYLVLNIIPHNKDLHLLEGYLKDIREINFDAMILSDPGTLLFVKEHLPNMEIHLSTQANNTNYMSAKFWFENGVKRVILAREMSFEEIAEILQKAPEGCEFEAFVHGAMCISYSGRCLLSNYMTGRDANKGDCAQSCRWNYYLVEEKRPNEYYPVVETEEGTFFFNSKDLCMIEYIPELIRSGLASLKIEGRNKSIYYVSNIVRVYREAIDNFYKDPENFVFKPEWLYEIKKASHRDFTTGFYNDKPTENDQHYTSSSYIRGFDFTGVVQNYDPETKLALVEQRNRMVIGDVLEVMGPDYFSYNQTITEMFDLAGTPIEVAPHAQQMIYIRVDQPVSEFYILRRERKDDSFE